MDEHFQALRDFLAREVVWHQSLWREPYEAEVLRVAPYTGVLIVREIRAGRVVLVDEVQIANDARFGADLLESGCGKRWRLPESTGGGTARKRRSVS